MKDAVTIRQDECVITLYLPELVSRPVPKIRRLFSLARSEYWENEDAIRTIRDFLADVIEDSRREWEAATKEFQARYVSLSRSEKRLTKEEKEARAAIRERNQKLSDDVRRKREVHERWKRIYALYKDTLDDLVR